MEFVGDEPNRVERRAPLRSFRYPNLTLGLVLMLGAVVAACAPAPAASPTAAPAKPAETNTAASPHCRVSGSWCRKGRWSP